MKSYSDPEDAGGFPSAGCSTEEHESDIGFHLHPSDLSFELGEDARDIHNITVLRRN